MAPTSRDGVFLLLRRLRAPLICLILVYSVAVTGLVLIPGVTPAGETWRMSFLHAFYFISFLGTTIGLGEIPHPFSDLQRLWVTGTIYTTVVAWLYAIGALLNTIQDPLFRRVMRSQRFERRVASLREPFVLLCGFDDAGHIVARELSEEGLRIVIVEADNDRVETVEVSGLAYAAIAYHGDASDPRTLESAGLRSPWCKAVVALTGNDDVNTKIALTATLLAPTVPLFAAVQDHLKHPRLIAAGADHLINPNDLFAQRIALSLRSPSLHVIYECLTTQNGRASDEPRALPDGQWMICGYGLFGRVLRRQLERLGKTVCVVGADLDDEEEGTTSHPGDPADPSVLRDAGVRDAAVIIACAPSDVDNLAIALAARELSPDSFIIVRQTQRRNSGVFRVSPADLVVLSGYLTAAEALRHLRAPLLARFLRMAAEREDPWASNLLTLMRDTLADHEVECWTVRVNAQECPRIERALKLGRAVELGVLCMRPGTDVRLKCIPLLLSRKSAGDTLTPDTGTPLALGDEILFCGDADARSAMRSRRHSQLFLRDRGVGDL